MTQEPKKVTFPRYFETCPCCGSTRRFTVEALKDVPLAQSKPDMTTALFHYERLFGTALRQIKLRAVGDACLDCGAPYFIALDKISQLPPVIRIPPGKPS